MNRILVSALVALLATSAAAQVPDIFLVDFEGLADGTPVDTQFASSGVTFSLANSTDLPVIALEGGPVTAFATNDNPMASGTGGITDPVVASDFTVGQDIVMTFSPPITTCRLFVIDIDGSESVTVNAMSGTSVVDTVTRMAGDLGTGNDASTEFFVAAPLIDRIVIDVPATIDYAVDFITFTRPCIMGPCGLEIEVSQESMPDLGDFDANVLGVIGAQESSFSAAQFYAYDVPNGDSWNGQSLDPISNTSHLLFANTTDGLTLFVVHDRPNDGSGGRAEMQFELFGDADGMVRTVEDDPNEGQTGSPGATLFTSRQSWLDCCTDGLALSDLEGNWEMLVEFTNVGAGSPNIGGMNDWRAFSVDGSSIQLALQDDRRVRLRALPPPACCADIGFAGPGGGLAISLCGDDLTLLGSSANFLLGGGAPLVPICLFMGTTVNPLAFPTGGTVATFPWVFATDMINTDASGLFTFTVGPTVGSVVGTFVIQTAIWMNGQYEFSNAIQCDILM